MAYLVCPECDASFKDTDVRNGVFPRHSFRGQPCAPPSVARVRKALGSMIREELERRGLPVLVEVDSAPPACGALRYTIDGRKLSPGEAAEHLGIVWP